MPGRPPRRGAAVRRRRPQLRRAGRAGHPAGPRARRPRRRAGDRVAVLTLNGLEAVETYLAAARLGAIGVPVNFRLVADEVGYALADSGAVALVVDPALAGVARRRRGPPRRPLRTVLRRLGAGATRRRGRGGPPSRSSSPSTRATRRSSCTPPDDRAAQGRGALPPQPADARVQPDRPPRLAPTTGWACAARRCSTSPGWPAVLPPLLLGGTIVITRSGAFDPAATARPARARAGDQHLPRAGAVAGDGRRTRHRRARPVALRRHVAGARRRRRRRCCAR